MIENTDIWNFILPFDVEDFVDAVQLEAIEFLFLSGVSWPCLRKQKGEAQLSPSKFTQWCPYVP